MNSVQPKPCSSSNPIPHQASSVISFSRSVPLPLRWCRRLCFMYRHLEHERKPKTSLGPKRFSNKGNYKGLSSSTCMLTPLSSQWGYMMKRYDDPIRPASNSSSVTSFLYCVVSGRINVWQRISSEPTKCQLLRKPTIVFVLFRYRYPAWRHLIGRKQ